MTMTVKQLYSYTRVKHEIERDQRRLVELRARVGAQSPRVTGMPHGGGDNTASQTERLALDIIALEDKIAFRQIELSTSYGVAQLYIAGVKDERMRSILTYRFLDCLPWALVADRVGGTEEGVRKSCYRYVNGKCGKV